MAVGLLTLHRPTGGQVPPVEFGVDGEVPVQHLRQQVSAAFGLTQGCRGLEYGGRIVASSRAVADVLGLRPDVVVGPTRINTARMRCMWELGTYVCLGPPINPDEGSAVCLREAPAWQVEAIACLQMSEGEGFVLLCSEP
mmetsp:Transcript_54172/g.117015  ORF Transcript_54172/g.117015 Transcript_54172/m.117015 type:complete len:140 (+) Transcript_54172:62-481(+)